MSKVFLIIGVFITAYTVIAKFTGIPLLTDFMPIDWYMYVLEALDDSNRRYKIVPSNETSYIWLYTTIVGILISTIGWLMRNSQ